MTALPSAVSKDPDQELFSDGKLFGEGHHCNGKRHGTWRFYYRNVRLKAAGAYLNGELDGYWEWWCKNDRHLQSGSFSGVYKVVRGFVMVIMARFGIRVDMSWEKRLVSGRLSIDPAPY